MPKKNDSDYPVGFGKPPKHSQFKPGKSGNPKGRPRKVPTIIDAFSKQARKVVTVPTKSGTQKMSMIDLLATKHWGLAVNGNPKSTAIVVKVLTPSETNHDEIERVESNGLLFGLLRETGYPAVELPLRSGDRLLLYTDGLTETERAGGEQFQEQRMDSVVKPNHAAGIEQLSETLFRESAGWQPASLPQQDDVTIVLVQVQ